MHFSFSSIVLVNTDPLHNMYETVCMMACEPLVACGKNTEQMEMSFSWDPLLTFG